MIGRVRAMAAHIEGSDGLLVEKNGPVVTITIDRPEVMNAMTTEMFANFGRICRQVSTDPGVRAVVVTGSGGNFCSGPTWALRASGPPPRSDRTSSEPCVGLVKRSSPSTSCCIRWWPRCAEWPLGPA